MDTRIKPQSDPSLDDLHDDQHGALAEFAMCNHKGTTWREHLKHLWWTGRDDTAKGRRGQEMGCYLRQIRNTFGPTWLSCLPAQEISSIFEIEEPIKGLRFMSFFTSGKRGFYAFDLRLLGTLAVGQTMRLQSQEPGAPYYAVRRVK